MNSTYNMSKYIILLMTIVCENYDTIPKYIPLKVNLNHIDRLIFSNPNIFDFIEIPNNISNKLKYLYNIDYTRFIPNYVAPKETFMLKLLTSLLSYHTCLHDITYIQTKLITEFASFSDSFTLVNKPIYDNINTMVDINNNMILVCNNNILLLIKDIIIIICTVRLDNSKGIIQCNNNDNIIMFSPNINYFESKDSTLVYKIYHKENNDIIVNTVMNSPNKKFQRMTYNINKIGDFTTTYYYEKYETNMKILSYTLQKSNGNIKEKMIKNGLYIKHNYNKKTNISKLISQCMIRDNDTGLHYRGKYEELKSTNIHKKTLTKDETIIYNKENNSVLVDSINNMNLKEDIIIGWKVAKSINGEKRIIKLMIPIDAKTIRPIDKEYFYTKGKERCNKAIVMDIQLPMEEDMISIVPTEMVAYSCIFNENSERFAYMVGKEVVPDLFDENDNESCTHGIHFYRNRMSVFDVYVNK